MNNNFEFQQEIVTELTTIKVSTEQIKKDVTKLDKQINGNSKPETGVVFRLMSIENILEEMSKKEKSAWQKLSLKGKVSVVVLLAGFILSFGALVTERLIEMFKAGLGM